MRVRIIALIVLALSSAVPVYGDAGMISLIPGVQLFEPNQRAVIAWNGKEEILILSTDTYASKPTKVLEVLPLRNEPTIEKGDPEIFEKATRLINEMNDRRRPPTRSANQAPPGAAAGAMPAGEVTQHKRIGRHDISVTHVLDEKGFFDWAEEYLRSQGADTPKIPKPIRNAVRGYLNRGFTWFVYDIVELGTTIQTNEPIQFRFKSDCVFYPLIITQTQSKIVNVQILLLTREYLWEYPELPRGHIQVGWQHVPDAQRIAEEMVILTQHQVQELSPAINDLFGQKDGIKLRNWTLIPDKHGRFHHDLVAR